MAIRQRLLYLSSETTHPESEVISMAVYEPVKGSITQIEPKCDVPMYQSVNNAQIDGWRVIHFPDQKTAESFDVIGYQFILEKLGEYND